MPIRADKFDEAVKNVILSYEKSPSVMQTIQL